MAPSLLPSSSAEAYVKHGLPDHLSAREQLKPLVEEWWDDKGWGKPPLPEIQHVGLIARPIATFRYEDAAFAELCNRRGLTPVWSEYTGDKMSSASNVKRSLLHVSLCSGRGKHAGLKMHQAHKLANINNWVGKPINTITTSLGGSLVDFHHNHQTAVFSQAIRFDWTPWLQRIGGAQSYYEAYLAMFIAHAVLFEDYHSGESGSALGPFSTGVFEPAWLAVAKRFGVTPLITKLPWHDHYRFYPADSNWRAHGVLQEEHFN